MDFIKQIEVQKDIVAISIRKSLSDYAQRSRPPLPLKYIWFVLSLPLEMELLLSHNGTSIRKSTNTLLNAHWALPNARYISVNPVAFAADTLKATWLLIIDHYWSIGGCALTIKHDFPLLGPRIPYVNRIRG